MSLTKRILFDRNPADDVIRQRMGEQATEYLREFPYRLPMKRKAAGGARRWDSRWPMSVHRAVRELDLDVVYVNEGVFARSREEIDLLKMRAENIWRGAGGPEKCR